MTGQDYERLGVFYLGRTVDENGETSADPLLYDAKDLTTHALVVGMTGSGKTGLSIGMLEEAALDGIPAIAIDPKGDLGNLLLTFPDLAAADFEPWIDPAEATRAGRSVPEQAAWTADLWRTGLGEWAQDGDRIRRFRDATDLTIYTPGASMGVPLSVMRSFAAPPEAVRADADALRERVGGAVSGLLALLGIEADPVQSRETILLANLLETAWSAGRDLDLGQLIRDIQQPPFDRLGVIDLETFYPSKDRMKLAMALNGLLASPGFAAWREGQPLDVERLLFREDGRPRIAIVSIAHLSDRERMFVVTLLLNEIVSWMRSQSGTGSLRAILYMDEIFGFFPPVGNPPSKGPMLTLLKQARAYGLGCVLATQNPVDLDYKGLSNCGSWFIGRLQTEQDRNRLLDGLESASGGGLDRSATSDLIGGLGKRVFLLNNVHEEGPVLFRTRWAMSYLRGPLVRSQIAELMADRRGGEGGAGSPARPAAGPVPAAPAPPAAEEAAGERPVLGDGVEEFFVPPVDEAPEGARFLYRPSVLAQAQAHFRRASLGVDLWQDLVVETAPGERSISWDEASVEEGEGPKLHRRPRAGASFGVLPASAQRSSAYSAAARRLGTHLYRHHRMTIWRHAVTKLCSEPGESEADFRRRVRERLAEERDVALEKLRADVAEDLERLQKRIRTAEERVERERSQHQDRKLQTAISFGTSLLGAVMGRRTFSGARSGATRTLRDLGRSRREGDDVERAEESLEELLEQRQRMEAEFEDAADELRQAGFGPEVELEAVELPLLKTDLQVRGPFLVWRPWSVDADGVAEPLF